MSDPALTPAGRHQTVVILDFGSQYTQLIARRVRENRVYCEVHPFDLPVEEIRRRQPIGVILSGGPQSVYEAGAAHPDARLYELSVPMLGICYGMQAMAHALGGSVEGAGQREYGRAEISIASPGELFAGLGRRETVWMSHGDHIAAPPPGFAVTASTANTPVVAFEHPEQQLWGIQFHPEVSHTVSGSAILRNFLYEGCAARGD